MRLGKCLAMVCLLSLCAQAAGAQAGGLSVKDGWVTGMLALGSTQIPVRMEEPDAPPAVAYQYKTRPMALSRERVVAALRQHGHDPAGTFEGQKWYLAVNDTANQSLLTFYPHGGVMAYGAGFRTGPPAPAAGEDAVLAQAGQTMKAFLDALGMDYEYPFHSCLYAFQAHEYPPPATLAEFHAYKPWLVPYREQARLTLVMARKRVDGFPYVMKDTGSDDTAGFGAEVRNPYAAALVDDGGRIVYAQVRSLWPETENRREEQRPLLTWQQALARLPDTRWWEDTLRSYTLKEIQKVEFSYCLTRQGIAVPVWQIYVWAWYNPSPRTNGRIPHPEAHNYNMLNFVIDAVTGEER